MLTWLAGACVVGIVLGAGMLFVAALVDSLLGDD